VSRGFPEKEAAMIGKWHLKSEPTGVDYWEVLIGRGPYYNARMIRNGKRVRHRGYTSDILTDPAYAEVVRRLKAELERLRRLYKVPPDTRPVRRAKR